MPPGNDIYEQVDRGIGLLCCSRRWWVDDETDRAFVKERELMKEPKHNVLAVTPVKLDGYLDPY